MKFLNGFKTIVGVVGSVLTVLIPKLDPSIISGVGDHLFAVAQGVFGLLTVLGIIHKVEKSKPSA
jgi:hypothetical protein